MKASEAIAGLCEHPERASGIPVDELPALLAELEKLRAVLWARVMISATNGKNPEPPDENLSVGEAARRLGVSASWIYKNRGSLPFVQGIGRRIVCSPAGLERWRRRHMGGPTA